MNTRQAKKVLRSARYHPEPRLQKAAARWRKRSRRVAWEFTHDREGECTTVVRSGKAGASYRYHAPRLFKLVFTDGYVGRIVRMGPCWWQARRGPEVVVAEECSPPEVLRLVGEL